MSSNDLLIKGSLRRKLKEKKERELEEDDPRETTDWEKEEVGPTPARGFEPRTRT